MKRDGSVRICGDCKVTVNPAARSDTYPIPHIDELFTKLSGEKLFKKLDLSHVYQQLVLSKTSREFVTINTHQGLFRYTHLPFGVSMAPFVFQRTMENLLVGIPGAVVFLDDLLATGNSVSDHLCNLKSVLKKLQDAGLRLQHKCIFLAAEVTYLGHKLTMNGIQPTDKKVRAITEAPAPKNGKELKSFRRLLNYYG